MAWTSTKPHWDHSSKKSHVDGEDEWQIAKTTKNHLDSKGIVVRCTVLMRSSVLYDDCVVVCPHMFRQSAENNEHVFTIYDSWQRSPASKLLKEMSLVSIQFPFRFVTRHRIGYTHDPDQLFTHASLSGFPETKTSLPKRTTAIMPAQATMAGWHRKLLVGPWAALHGSQFKNKQPHLPML